ncbi:hypothetical protein ACIHJG_38955 [Streptomyces sp. NPDC052415]
MIQILPVALPATLVNFHLIDLAALYSKGRGTCEHRVGKSADRRKVL